MADLQLKNVSKAYGTHSVIPALSLDIAHGEFVVLVGPSGCGKSTLLRMIAGLEDITGGDLIIGGTRANDIQPQKRDISMVFQSYALFPHMSVRDNIAFGPRIRREKAAETETRLQNAAQILNLKPYLDRKPGQLSGGQRQRVAMGRAIVRDPKVFLFDEPLSNLDAKLRISMRTEIKALHQQLGATIIYVTHDQIEAMTMADRIVVMEGGRIAQVGTPMELYDRPASKFVAGFIGSPAMSFLDATYHRDDHPHVRLPSGMTLDVGAHALPEATPVTVGIRPETYRIDPNGALSLNIQVIEPTGPETHLFGTIEGQEVRCVLRERLPLSVGQNLRLSVDPAHIHLFATDETGARLR